MGVFLLVFLVCFLFFFFFFFLGGGGGEGLWPIFFTYFLFKIFYLFIYGLTWAIFGFQNNGECIICSKL